MQSEGAQSASESTGGWSDLLAAWRIVVKRRWLVIATAVSAFAVVLGWNLRKPKIYQAQATVVIEPNAPKILGQANEVVQLGSGVAGVWASADYYNTQQKILQSWSLSEKVVRKHNLWRDHRLVGTDVGSLPEEDLVKRATQALQLSIRVLPVKDSRVFGVGVRHTDPAFAAELANWVVAVYTQQNIHQKLEVTSDARRWVAEKVDEAAKKLKEAEQALTKFRSDNNVLAVAIEDRQNILTGGMLEFSKALNDSRKARIDLESRQQAVALLLQEDALDAPLSKTVSVGALDTIRTTYLEERRKLLLLEQRYGQKHHEVIYAKTRVDAARVDLEREARNVLKAMNAEIKALKSAESRYSVEVERLKEEALRLNEKEVDYKRLVREAEDAAQNYTALLKRHNENRLQEQDEANNIRLLDRARVPRLPVEPNMTNVIVLAIALALMLSLGLAYFVQFMDRTVKIQEDVEAVSGYPVLGFVPSVEKAPANGDVRELYIMKNPTSTAAESCRVIRTNIIFCSPDKPLRSMVVTSSNPVEGKTMTVVNLGIVMAQAGHRTLLIDSDMRRPRLHKVLKAPNERGLSSLIVGECNIEDAVKSTDVSNLYLLPCGPIPPNPAELLQTERFGALAQQLAGRFDRVIFDSPPLLAVTDAALLSRVVDGTILVVRAGKTTRDALTRAKRLLDAVSARVIGVVVNDVNLKSATYAGYYYYYNYYQERAPATAEAGAGDRA